MNLRDELDPDSSRNLSQREIAERVRIEREHDPDAEQGHIRGGYLWSLEAETKKHAGKCPGCGKQLKNGTHRCPECFSFVWGCE